MRVNVGDVLLINYMDFEEEIQTAMFVVCYHECFDNLTSGNFTAIKISTNPMCYQVKLLKDYLPFLNYDSYLNCNQMMRFREDQVQRIVGRLTPYYLNKMLQQSQNYFNKMKYEITQAIGPNNLFKDFSKPQKFEGEIRND